MSGRLDIAIDKGAEFELSLQLINDDSTNPIDLTGCTGSFTVLNKDTLEVITTGEVNITDPTLGQVTLSIPYTTTATIPQMSKHNDPMVATQDYMYHFDIIDTNNKPKRYLRGYVQVRR